MFAPSQNETRTIPFVDTDSHVSRLQFQGSLILIILVTLIAYARIMSLQLLNWDDGDYVVLRPEIQQGLTLNGIRWAFTTFQNANWHPLTWMSHMLDIQLFGVDSGMMHLMNLAIHCANVILVALVVRGLTARPTLALLVAMAFAIHPQHVEVVAWVSERKELLSTFFGLFAILMWQRFSTTRCARNWCFAHGLYLLALLSKQMLVTLPCLFLVLAACPLKRGDDAIQWRQIYKTIPRLWLFFVLSIGFSICVYIAQMSGGAVVSDEALPMWMRFGNAVQSVFMYVVQTLVPIRLNPFYRYHDVSNWIGSLALMSISLIVITVWVWRNRCRPAALAGWLWFLGTLVPVLGFVQLSVAARADRYVYFPHIGLFILIGALPLWNSVLFKGWGKAFGAVIVVLFATASFQQSLIWSDSVSLWTACLRIDPDNYRGHDLLAQAYLREERVDDALQQAQIALQYPENKDSPYLNLTLGSALLYQGDTAGATAHLREAISLHPSNVSALINLGYALHETDLAESKALFSKARSLDPGNVEAIGNLANCEAETGNFPRAIELLREAISFSPKDARLQENKKLFEEAFQNHR